MSTPFTSPANATWQALLDELVLAYSERRQALSQSAYTAADDRDVQAASYWTTLQGWIETNCLSFIDHVSGPLTGDNTAFLYFTLATFRAAAGLHADGFRRSTDGSSFSYGQMQPGDIIGPWIFEDLQKGFSLLLKTVRDITGGKLYRRQGIDDSWVSWDDAKTTAIDEWNAAISEVMFDSMVFSDGYYYKGSGFFQASLTSFVASDLTVSDCAIGHQDTDVYVKAAKNAGYDEYEFDAIDTGFIEDQLVSVGSLSDTIGTMTIPNWPGSYPEHPESFGIGFKATIEGVLIKWNFTNQN